MSCEVLVHDDIVHANVNAEAGAVDRVATGVDGLDEILMGGLPTGGIYLLRGGPGCGKTTLGLQFLLAGVEAGDRCLFISLAQPVQMIERIASSHGMSLDGIDVRAITAHDAVRLTEDHQDVFVPDEVELADLTERIRAMIEDVRPTRMVFDSLNFIKMFVTAPGRYEQEMAVLVELCGRLGITALCILNSSEVARSEMILDGTIALEQLDSPYGGQMYRLAVRKVRASPYHGGFHDFSIVRGGLRVFPRLIDARPGTPRERLTTRSFGSGQHDIDELVGGELRAGTSVLIMGPSGTGKSTLALRYVHTALEEGRKALYFLLEERTESFLNRAARLRMDLRPFIDGDRARVVPIQATRILPGELAVVLRDSLRWRAEIVVIDSLSGYYQLVPDAGLLRTQVRDIMRHAGSLGALTIVTLASENVLGAIRPDSLDVSEAADVVIHHQLFEAEDGLRKGVTVVKRRDGDHDPAVRELILDARGLRISSEPVRWRGPVRAAVGAVEGGPPAGPGAVHAERSGGGRRG